MNRLIYFFCVGILLIPVFDICQAADVTKEKIIFINEDGKNFIVYETIRTSYSAYNLWYNKNKGDDIENYFRNYLYFYPNDYNWNSSAEDHCILNIPRGNYAILSKANLSSKIKVDHNGVYTYKSWDGITYGADGHFGSWNTPDDFSQYAYVWVFPEKYEVVGYECNKGGEWVKRHNTIAYYGNDVNDLVFTIKYRTKAGETFKTISGELSGKEAIQLNQDGDNVKITLGATVLFQSGSAELTDDGESIMSDVAEALVKKKGIRIIVEGHTDNVPIKGELQKVFKTNWELSAARSLTVLHYLSQSGIPESNLESHAFGSQRPVSLLDNEESRKKNRRIELLISEDNK